MTRYLSDPIPVDRGSIRAQIDESAQARLPGIDTTSPGTAYDFLANIIVDWAAEQRQLLTQQLEISFRGSLEKVDRVLQNDAVQATATGTLTRAASDVDERTVGAGTAFNLQGASGEPVEFQLVNDETFPAADDELTNVELIATLGGTGGNGLSTVLGPAQTVAWYASLVLGGATSGGEDAETDDDYLDRGADERPGRAFTIVLPDDLGRYLRNQAGVDRVQVVDNYDADTSTADVGGHITAIPIDEDGAALSGGTMTTLAAAAQALAVTGLEVHVIAPTDTTFTIRFAGYAETGFDADDDETRAEDALAGLLDRSRWGLPSSGDERAWRDLRILRFQDVVTALNNVQGFDFYAAPTGTATTSNGSPNLTLVTPTTGWVNGMPVTGTGIPGGTTISSGAGTATMIMSANASASAAGVTITGSGLSVNGGVADVSMTGPGALPGVASTVAGEVQAAA